MKNVQAETQKLYAGLGWISLFSRLRFWTGSLAQIEKNLPQKGKIIDLGCGYGLLANYLGLCSAKRKVLGIEIDQEKLDFCRREVANVSFIKADATKMDFPKAQGIAIIDVLHHLQSCQEQERLIKKCFESLVKKGLLIITEVDKKPLWKLILARLTDFFLYPGKPIFYRYQSSMLALLRKYFDDDKIKIEKLLNNPFPHLLYRCQKN